MFNPLFKELKLNHTYFARLLGISKSRFTEVLQQNESKHHNKIRTYLKGYATQINDFLFNNP